MLSQYVLQAVPEPVATPWNAAASSHACCGVALPLGFCGWPQLHPPHAASAGSPASPASPASAMGPSVAASVVALPSLAAASFPPPPLAVDPPQPADSSTAT